MPSFVEEDSENGDLGAAQTTSDVFQFIVQTQDGTFDCTFCLKLSKHTAWKSRSTTNFRKHLIHYHGDKYKCRKQQSVVVRDGFVSSDHAFDPAVATEWLLRWIVDDSQAFEVVSGESFIGFCHSLRPEYCVPSRKVIRDRVIKRWNEEKAYISQLLLNEVRGRRVGLTTDMWTSTAGKGYMVVTLHFLDDEWRMRSLVIGFLRVYFPHTGIRLANHLIQAVKLMNPGLLVSVWAVTSDNASNNKSMITHLNTHLQREVDVHAQRTSELTGANDQEIPSARRVFQIPCIAHTLNLAVKQGFKAVPAIESVIGRLRDIFRKIKDSTKLSEKCEECCTSKNLTYERPPLDVETRWNSTYSMIQYALKYKIALMELLSRIQSGDKGYTDLSIDPESEMASVISTTVWKDIATYFHFLKPFAWGTTLMSGSSYPTLGIYLPVFSTVQYESRVTMQMMSEECQPFAQAVLGKLDEYSSLMSEPHLLIASTLDPRAKKYVTKIAGADEIKRLITEDYNNEYKAVFECNSESDLRSPPSHGADALTLLTPNRRGTIEAAHSLQHLMDDAFGVESPSRDHAELFEDEFERWMKSRCMTIDATSVEVAQFFLTHVGSFPRICLMARDYLGVTASSVPSESAFSRAGQIVTDKRSRLTDEAVQALVELQSFQAFKKESSQSK